MQRKRVVENQQFVFCIFIVMYFLKDFVYLFLERGREGERERKKHQCVVASQVPPTGDLAYNPGMCPDWEQNQQPFGSQAGTQSTEPYQPGPLSYISRFLYLEIFFCRNHMCSSNFSLVNFINLSLSLYKILPLRYKFSKNNFYT